MGEERVFQVGINYDSYFKRPVTQSGFNLRLTQLVEKMLSEMKDDLYSDTFEVKENILSVKDLITWGNKQSPTPKGSDLLVVDSGPIKGVYRVKSKKLESEEDLIKLSGFSDGDSQSAVVEIKIGDKTLTPDKDGVIDLSDYIMTQSDRDKIETMSTEVEELKEKVEYLSDVMTRLTSTVNDNTSRITYLDDMLDEQELKDLNDVMEITPGDDDE